MKYKCLDLYINYGYNGLDIGGDMCKGGHNQCSAETTLEIDFVRVLR